MALYAASIVTTVTTATAGLPVASFKASSTQRAEVRRIRIYQRTAGTAPNELAIIRSTAVSTVPAATAVGVPLDPSAVATTGQLEAGGWTVAPVTAGALGSNVLDAFSTDATPGNMGFFEYDLVRSIFVPIGSGTGGALAFVNGNATALATYRIVLHWEE